ncbi:PQQ-dependent sugar dehydrogenase [Candidatus Acetothermia bacterium]|nr:PQQ-dependent sugar dehydrogenase [Candidatus Acetothermia bacterium]
MIPLQVFGTDFTFQQIASGLSSPVAITNAKDGSGRLFITLKAGKVVIYDGTQVLPTAFLDITSLVLCCDPTTDAEQGLLSVAFHPNYASNGFFYVDYTRKPDGATVIARYSRSSNNPNLADPNSALVLLTIPQPFSNHNGGQLQFGPDGYLYIGMGDGGSGGDPQNNGQGLNTLLGKILRLDVNSGSPYAIPSTNPFANDGDPINTRDEIWAYGLRNPWRFGFDRLTGDLFIADVGQNSWEEVDFQPASSTGGQNYGWRIMEGTHCFNPSIGCNMTGLTLPILEYGHVSGNCSITGGYRYRGSRIPELYGLYLYGDFCSGRIWGATFNGSTWTTAELMDTAYLISTFGEDESGEIYFAAYSSTNGTVYRIIRVTTAALFTVHRSSGNVYADGAYFCGKISACFNSSVGADIAERINSLELLEPGDVIEIDPEHSGYFRKSRGTPLVVGVVSTHAGLTMANRAAQTDVRPSIALIGRVPVKTITENGPIKLGDLLTPSNKPGYAMRCHSPCVTPILGKALGALSAREGWVMMLVMRP